VTVVCWDISSQRLKNDNKHTHENLREIIRCTVRANDGHEAEVFVQDIKRVCDFNKVILNARINI